MTGCVVTVLYPQVEGATFDLDYYLKKHMPMVMEKWKPAGMIGWSVNKFHATGDSSAPPYSIEAILQWPDLEKFQAAASTPAMGEIMGDIENFSNKQPVIMIGDVVGTS